MSDKRKDDMSARTAERVAGLVSTILGIGLAYIYLYLPLQQARASAPKVAWIGDWGFVSPMFIILGAVLTIFPQFGALVDSKKLRNENGSLNALGIITTIAILAPLATVCFAVNHYFQSQLRHLGYVDGNLVQGSK
ncbi:MAG: hypothetical protein P4M09_11165 [Devosia sp.]|nr:hypothetical protein [Devosia sp.]